MHEEPWAFAVIQDKKLLDCLSEGAKTLVRNEAKGGDPQRSAHVLHVVDKPDFNVSDNLGALIVI
jgi:hypothetical protein